MIKSIVRMVVLSAAYVALAFAYLALAINVAINLVVREFALLFVPRAVRSEVRRLNPVLPVGRHRSHLQQAGDPGPTPGYRGWADDPDRSLDPKWKIPTSFR